MGGGILQLVAYGIQDLIFSQNPDITFFKTSYNRYTNFTIDQQLLDFSSKVEFNKKAQCIIKRNADLESFTMTQKTGFDSRAIATLRYR